MPAAKDRIALVTGANKGIGFEIARQLGENGAHLLIGARDRDRGQAAVADLRREGFAARYVQIDLTALATIAAAAADIEAQEGRLDILINNAGVTSSGDGSPGAANLDAVRRTFDTNFFGTLAVTRLGRPRSATGCPKHPTLWRADHRRACRSAPRLSWRRLHSPQRRSHRLQALETFPVGPCARPISGNAG